MSMQDKEFQYEEQLCREDKKIATYFKVLPKYMDLPSENEFIIDELNYELELDKKKLIQAKKNIELPHEFIKIALNLDDDFSQEESDEFNFDDVFAIVNSKVEYGYLIDKFKLLSKEYILKFSHEARILPHRKYMQIITIINKIVSKLQDLLIVTHNDVSLKNCLCKRILKEFNLLINLLNNLQDYLLINEREEVMLDIDKIKIARTTLLAILFEK